MDPSFGCELLRFAQQGGKRRCDCMVVTVVGKGKLSARAFVHKGKAKSGESRVVYSGGQF
jgi:hypothetical protein